MMKRQHQHDYSSLENRGTLAGSDLPFVDECLEVLLFMEHEMTGM